MKLAWDWENEPVAPSWRSRLSVAQNRREMYLGVDPNEWHRTFIGDILRMLFEKQCFGSQTAQVTLFVGASSVALVACGEPLHPILCSRLPGNDYDLLCSALAEGADYTKLRRFLERDGPYHELVWSWLWDPTFKPFSSLGIIPFSKYSLLAVGAEDSVFVQCQVRGWPICPPIALERNGVSIAWCVSLDISDFPGLPYTPDDLNTCFSRASSHRLSAKWDESDRLRHCVDEIIGPADALHRLVEVVQT